MRGLTSKFVYNHPRERRYNNYMSWNIKDTSPRDGDLVELVGLRHKHFIFTLKAGTTFQSHRGVIQHDDLIGLPWGSQIRSHQGSPFVLIQPALPDLLRDLPRRTQILYPKDIGYILMMLGIGPGVKVIEAGTGSGGLTSALAFAVGREGCVYTYEAKAEVSQHAENNVKRFGLEPQVVFHVKDIQQGFEQSGVDALFLDLPNPYDYMPQVRAALKPGGAFGCILPTSNQVILLLSALRQARFAFVDVCEIMIRFYQAEYSKFRPTDRMVAHTGFLIFARPVNLEDNPESLDLLAESPSLD
jgi:tRNA (adenine57-N1/adenine58-N1)-methyltransferase